MRDDQLARADAALLAEVDGALAAGARRAGGSLTCAPGCTECCLGPFAVNALDAWRLGRGRRELARTDPDRAAALAARAAAAVATLHADFPGDPTSGELGDDDDAVGAFLGRHRALPCPALDPASGRCELYAWRPLACRSFGLPVAIGDVLHPPCRLCFVGASAGEVDACRVAIDPGDREAALLDRLEAAGTVGETLVAWALAEPRTSR